MLLISRFRVVCKCCCFMYITPIPCFRSKNASEAFRSPVHQTGGQVVRVGGPDHPGVGGQVDPRVLLHLSRREFPGTRLQLCRRNKTPPVGENEGEMSQKFIPGK